MLKKSIIISAVMSAIASSAHAEGQIVSIQDVNKTIVHQTPYTTEICRDYQTSGDKTGDTLMGALIGGAIGNNVGDIKDGGALGAILGGMWAHQNSDAKGGIGTKCKTITRYNEESRTVYSHSILTFRYNGRTYTTKFKK
tara:strand:- start:2242 stop:2661 length:420 start_codon:yes stop_codon:yes gene_type:complete